MPEVVDNIRAKIKRRFSHKEPNTNFDDYDEADEETNESINKEYDDAEKNDNEPYGKPGSLINRMIMHGNKKTEDQIAAESAARERQTTGATSVAPTTASGAGAGGGAGA